MSEQSSRLFSKNFRDIGFLLFAFLATMVVIWNFASHILSPLLMKAKLFQAEQIYKVMLFLYESFGGVINYNNLNPAELNWYGKEVAGLGLAIQKYNIAIENGYVFTAWELIKAWYHFGLYPFLIYLVLFALILCKYIRNSEAKFFRTSHSMDSLILQERTLYPEIYPVSEQDLINSSDTTGIFASPLQELEFAEKHQLFMDSKEQNSLYRNAFGQEFRRLDKEKSKQVFDSQLKERFLGFENMSRHRQAIFAIIGLGTLDNTPSLNYKNQYCVPKARELAKRFYDNGNKVDDGMFGDWIEEFYGKFKDTEDFKQFALNRHAYELPMFMTLLQGFYSQQGVVNMTSLFWWLRIVDYPLFLALNYVRRQKSAFVEIAGVASHWETEVRLKTPIIGKRTEAAVEDLERKVYSFTDNGVRESLFRPT